MDDIQKIKEQFHHDLKLWIAEKQRAMELQKMKDSTSRKSGRKREKEARVEIAKIEHKLERLKEIKNELKEVARY